MNQSLRLDGLLTRLQSEDPSARDLAAAEIGDLFEYDQLDEREFKKAVHTLIPLALTDKNANARESMFNALSEAAEATGSWRVDWQPIAAELHSLTPDCVEHALVILGFSGEARYRATIRPFLRHADERFQTAADDALKMLGCKGRNSTAPTKKGRTQGN
jgi:HEAT repeat protein